MTDIRALKSKVLNGDDPVRTLILSLPDDISREDLVSKMDLILRILDDPKGK
jgi:hypothetical protein